jgi:hypothetical protein
VQTAELRTEPFLRFQELEDPRRGKADAASPDLADRPLESIGVFRFQALADLLPGLGRVEPGEGPDRLLPHILGRIVEEADDFAHRVLRFPGAEQIQRPSADGGVGVPERGPHQVDFFPRAEEAQEVESPDALVGVGIPKEGKDPRHCARLADVSDAAGGEFAQVRIRILQQTQKAIKLILVGGGRQDPARRHPSGGQGIVDDRREDRNGFHGGFAFEVVRGGGHDARIRVAEERKDRERKVPTIPVAEVLDDGELVLESPRAGDGPIREDRQIPRPKIRVDEPVALGIARRGDEEELRPGRIAGGELVLDAGKRLQQDGREGFADLERAKHQAGPVGDLEIAVARGAFEGRAGVLSERLQPRRRAVPLGGDLGAQPPDRLGGRILLRRAQQQNQQQPSHTTLARRADSYWTSAAAPI